MGAGPWIPRTTALPTNRMPPPLQQRQPRTRRSGCALPPRRATGPAEPVGRPAPLRGLLRGRGQACPREGEPSGDRPVAAGVPRYAAAAGGLNANKG
eukprot:scaffold47109_cov63-Phaeocystis_antarctica.AAC.1